VLYHSTHGRSGGPSGGFGRRGLLIAVRKGANEFSALKEPVNGFPLAAYETNLQLPRREIKLLDEGGAY